MIWTKEEVILIVQDYFAMFRKELDGISYNKAEHRRKLAPLLNNRDNAIEYKHMNISAVLSDMGYPYIRGYKPYFQYQKLLADEVALYLENNRRFFEKVFLQFADKKVDSSISKTDFNKILDKGPGKSKRTERVPLFLPFKTNYLAKEQNNRQLGEKGEQLVFDYEKWRLINEGKEKLAEQVEWVAKDKGDGMGYDILSKNNNGTDRFIEVKTTKLTKETPFFFSRNEWKFAKIKGKQFYLYRVYNITEKPQFFIKQGNYESFCSVLPQSFKGYF